MKVFIAICLVALVYAEDSDKENIDLNVLDDLAAPYRSDIVDGSPAGECEFPSIVSLEIKKNGRGFLCGGTLIDSTHVLTAAKCVASGVIAIKVKMGSVNSQYPKLVRVVSYIKPHQGFSATNRALHNDVAMLTLDKPVRFGDCIKAIPLAKSSDSFERQNCVTAGWGKTGWNMPTSRLLRKVKIPIMSYRECHNKWSHIGRDHICAGDWRNGGPSPCQGDPVVLFTANLTVDGFWRESFPLGSNVNTDPLSTQTSPTLEVGLTNILNESLTQPQFETLKARPGNEFKFFSPLIFS